MLNEKLFFVRHCGQDVDEIVTYMAKETPAAAFKFLDALYETMDLLASNPRIGPKREDLTNKLVRFWSFKWHYLIVYNDYFPIEIVRILSGYRDISSLLG